MPFPEVSRPSTPRGFWFFTVAVTLILVLALLLVVFVSGRHAKTIPPQKTAALSPAMVADPLGHGFSWNTHSIGCHFCPGFDPASAC